MRLSAEAYLGQQPLLFLLSIGERKGELLVRKLIPLELDHDFLEEVNGLEVVEVLLLCSYAVLAGLHLEGRLLLLEAGNHGHGLLRCRGCRTPLFVEFLLELQFPAVALAGLAPLKL